MKKFLGLVLAVAFLATGSFAQERPGTSAAATQTTSATTAVTVNGTSGVITTVSETTAAGATTTFTVTNDSVLASSTPIVQVCNYTGAGIPIVRAGAVAAGSFTITITNIHASAALNAALKICFQL